MAKLLPELTIIKDRREQKGWDFEPEDKVPGRIRVKGTIWGTLSAGDYTIEGLEDVICIERKMGLCELFGNMSPKEHKERFLREMEKLRDVRHKYIVIEDNLSSDVLNLGVPQMYRGPTGNVVFKWLLELQAEYGIVPIFAGNAGKKVVRSIFETIVRKYI